MTNEDLYAAARFTRPDYSEEGIVELAVVAAILFGLLVFL